MISHPHKTADLSNWRVSEIRIAAISDTHGFVDPRIVEVASSCNAVIHAGDIGTASVIRSLEPMDGFIFAVAGNNDVASKWPNADLDILESLPGSYEIVLPSGKIAVEHGHKVRDARRYHESLRMKHSDCRAVIYGHTHVRVIDSSTTPWMINPGAAGRIRTRGGPSCCVIEICAEKWTVEEVVFDFIPAKKRRY